jgi:hypothetical protein
MLIHYHDHKGRVLHYPQGTKFSHPSSVRCRHFLSLHACPGQQSNSLFHITPLIIFSKEKKLSRL